MSVAAFKEITESKNWTNDQTFKAAKELQRTSPLAWWITVGNFRKVHAHYKGMEMDDTVKEGKGMEGRVWDHIKEQKKYPYQGLKDLSLNEVFESDVAKCESRKEVEKWAKENKGHKNMQNVLNKLNTYKHGKEKFKAGVNAYDMTNYCTIPSTRTTGLGVAMHMHTEDEIRKMVAGEKSVQPQVMLSHAWTEDMDEVMGILNDCVTQKVKLDDDDNTPFSDETRVWFCCFAIYQPFKFNKGPRINTEEVDNVTVYEQMILNGFDVVSAIAADMIVIHTTKGDAYARMWCIVELWGAIKTSRTIHMIGSKEYFLKYMSEVKVGKVGTYVLKGHPAAEGSRKEVKRKAIGKSSGEGLEPLNFYEFLVDFSKSDAGGNKEKMQQTLKEEMDKINKEFVDLGGQQHFLEKNMAVDVLPKEKDEDALPKETVEDFLAKDEDADEDEDLEDSDEGEDEDGVFNVYKGLTKKKPKGKTMYELHLEGKEEEVKKIYEEIDIEFMIRMNKTRLVREGGDVQDNGITFVENVVAFMRMKWLQNVAKSYDGKEKEFMLPHWKMNPDGELEAVDNFVVVKSDDAKTKSINISGYLSSSGGNTRSSSFARLANSLAQATDNMIGHSQQLEDEFVAKEAIIRSQEQRIRNQNARITALERQATRAAPTRRVTANTRTTARNRNADEVRYYC